MSTLKDATPRTVELFVELAKDAPNWSGEPLWGGNVRVTRKDRGNLTDLKKRGLVTTFVDEGETWVLFTDEGAELAKNLVGFDPRG